MLTTKAAIMALGVMASVEMLVHMPVMVWGRPDVG